MTRVTLYVAVIAAEAATVLKRSLVGMEPVVVVVYGASRYESKGLFLPGRV
jgi:hypothetical protein